MQKPLEDKHYLNTASVFVSLLKPKECVKIPL